MATWNRTDTLISPVVTSNGRQVEGRKPETALGTFLSYDDLTGKLVNKTSPDSGTVQYYYDEQGHKRLEVHLSNSPYVNDDEQHPREKMDHIIYHLIRVEDGQQVIRTGNLNESESNEFRSYLFNGTLDMMQTSAIKDYQLIKRQPSESHENGGKVTITNYNDDYPVMETISWNDEGQMERRKISFVLGSDLTEVNVKKILFMLTKDC